MPHVYAHNYCAKMALDRLEKNYQEIWDCISCFYWGAQGPDPWFYHKRPFRKGVNYRQFGNRLHTEKTGETFAAYLDAVKNTQSPALFAYFSGYLCHYALDCAAHPYVCFRTTQDTHTLFEADMDTALLISRGESLASQPLPGRLPEIDAAVFRQFFSASAAVLGLEIPPDEYRVCVEDMRKCMRMLYDPRGVKRPFVGIIDAATHSRGLIVGTMHAVRPNKTLDSLNNARQPYYHQDGSGPYANTFIEMMSAAADSAAGMIDAVYAAVYGGGSMQEALARIGANSFETGKPMLK